MMRCCLLGLAGAIVFSAAGFAQLPQVQTVPAGETLQGRFVQDRHLAGMDVPLHSEGRFLLAPDKGLIWRGDKPFETVTVITPAGILQSVNGEQVQRLPAARLPFVMRFYQMLSGALAGDWAAMARDFRVDRQGDEQAWKIVLTPRQADDPVAGQLASITVSGGRLVEGVEIRRPNGDWETLAFRDQVLSDSPLSPEDAGLLAAVAK